MDYQSLKRRDLQSLCKRNNIPANITNAAMIDALASLTVVEGLEEFMGNPQCETQGSPERSVITSPAPPRTTTHRKALKEEVECSGLATRTRRGTKTNVKEGTDTRKTTATRTTRRRVCQEASVKKEMEKDLQADFEADMEQSEVSEDSVHLGGELKEISEEISGVSVESEVQLSENQNEAENESQQSYVGEEVIDVDDIIVDEAQEEPSESKVDFHSLNRKDLQNLCKKNKIAANMTNAAMADALASLETVEGLEEFMKDYNPQALSSPLLSGVATSCARRSRTTVRMNKEPQSSTLVTKSCRSSRRRILEEDEQVKNDVARTPVGSVLCERESVQEKEESAAPKSELNQLDTSSYEDRECSAVFSSGELEDPEVSEVLGVGDINNILVGKDNVLNVENSEEPEELVVKMDENPVEEFSKDTEVFILVGESSKDTEFSIVVEPELVANSITKLENLKTFEADAPALIEKDQISEECISESSMCSELNEYSNSGNSKLENVEIENEEDQTTEKFDSKSPAQADKLSPDSIGESESDETEGMSEDSDSDTESEGSYPEEEISKKSDNKLKEIDEENEFDGSSTEDDMSDNSESESESVGSFTEEDMSVKSDIEETTQGDELPETNVESESEDSCTEDEKFDSELISQEDQDTNASDFDPTIQGDKLPEINVAPLENNQIGNVSNKIDIETSQADMCAPTEQETPLQFKSMRKLKRILKEKLQAAALAKNMENLTLEESQKPISEVEEDLTGLPVKLSDILQESEGVLENGVINSEVNTTSLYPVDLLVDNEVIPEDDITGDIDVIACQPQSTPAKVSSTSKLFTPPSKKSMSVGRKNCVLDVNKENIIDSAASKTEPGKIKVAVTESGNILSAMSMGKLKKEFKSLQQQSEKKRQALQSRSENNCILTSP